MLHQVTLSWPLYKRTTPSNEEPPVGYLRDGVVLTVTDVVAGKPVDGNSVWFKGADNLYYWSGGVAETEFVINDGAFLQASSDQQYAIASEAMDYYFDLLAEKLDAFTGMAATRKQTNGNYGNVYALVVQVAEKKPNPVFKVPGTLPYRGFSIPTDVIAAGGTAASELGQTISRIGMASYGSPGFVTSLKNISQQVLVTNYHVACADLLLRFPRQLTKLREQVIPAPEMVMPDSRDPRAKPIGTLLEGRLDRYNDVAIVALNSDHGILNQLPQIGALNGILPFDELRQHFEPGKIRVQMYGAVSLHRSAFIIALNAAQPISYMNGLFKHTLRGLIQVEKLSQPGDSGSAIVNDDKKLVGILVAADDQFSYVMPIENVLRNFNLNTPL